MKTWHVRHRHQVQGRLVADRPVREKGNSTWPTAKYRNDSWNALGTPGKVRGNTQGTPEGTPEGTPYGAPYGAPQGNTLGNILGNTLGNTLVAARPQGI